MASALVAKEKRQGTAAVQNLAAIPTAWENATRLGVRQTSAALERGEA